MKRCLGAVFLLTHVLLACGKLPTLGPPDGNGKLATASQEDCGFVQNSYGQRVSWKQSLPVKMYIDSTFPQQYETVLRSAATQWETLVGKSLFTFERAATATTPAHDNRNVIYWENPWSADMTLQGMTTLSWQDNQLTEADLHVDAQYFTYYVDTPQAATDVHLESLLVHELGHVLGLKHVGGESVMLSVLNYLTIRDLPTDDDKAHIKCEYN